MNATPFVCLGHAKNGTCYTLKLQLDSGKPTVLWEAAWVGGYGHYNMAGNYVTIPSEMLSSLTPDSLQDWMLHKLGDQVPLADFRPPLSEDKQVIAWCQSIRQLYCGPSASEQSASWEGL